MNARAIALLVICGTMANRYAEAAKPQDEPLRTPNADRAHRSVTAIKMDVRDGLRAEALSRRLGPNPSHVLNLIDLYREIAAHPKRDQGVVLMKLGLQLRSRLKRISDQIERNNWRGDHRPKSASRRSVRQPATQVLAQQIGVPGGPAPGLGAPPTANQPGATTAEDFGPELVELIQETISPATWDINGGNGSIAYFGARHAMVVSAPEAVHDQIVDLLGQLRAAP
jgi:hypothetical protein